MRDNHLNAEDVLQRLRDLKPTIMARYKVRAISLFGSWVRGEQKSGSDIDLLAEFDNEADLFDSIGLELHLEKIFKCRVDIVFKSALRPELQKTVLSQVVSV